MRQTRLIRPDYVSRFACLGSQCEDTCCANWLVSIDEATCNKYAELTSSPLFPLLDDCILRHKEQQDAKGLYAAIRMLPTGECPFLSKDRLCRIQLEHGASFLSSTCANYPRTAHTIDGLKEETLSLSCPEAARLVLLSPRLLPPPEQPGYQLTWDETAPTGASLRAWFWQIRAFVVSLIQNRGYPLWQRLFLLGIFCRRLEALSRGELDRSVPTILDEFSRAVAARELKSAMETIPADPCLQLEVILQLIVQRANANPLSPRIHQVLTEFAGGIEHSRTAGLQSQAACYTKAHDRYYAPFFRRHPYILENYLVNFVLRDVFPFAGSLFEPGVEPEPARAYVMLAIQFSVLKGLLIGVAGAKGRRLSAADVVRTVQAGFKYFEHNPKFLSEACELLSARGMTDTRGLTTLLRN